MLYGEVLNRAQSYAPGQHGQKSGARRSDYAVQCAKSRKFGVSTGCLSGSSAACIRKLTGCGASLVRPASVAGARLDNVTYRMGFGASRSEARQVVRHNAIW